MLSLYHLYANDRSQGHRGTLFVNFILQKTLSPCPPPRLPDRPHPPLRYPIIATRKLIDLSDAPEPPPRSIPAPSTTHFISNITKNDANATREFHTSTIRFTEGNDKAKLKLTLSNQKKVPNSQPCNGSTVRPVPPVPRPVTDRPRPRIGKTRTQEVILICVTIVIAIILYISQRNCIYTLSNV